MKRKICVVSSGRADYGLLYWPMRAIQECDRLELQTIVTGMHLSDAYGMTVNRFELDGFPVSGRVEMLLSSDSPVAVTKSLGLGVIGFADAFDQLRPDMVMLLGDRYEILAAAQAALIAKVPVAHLFGGDTTEGAFDESIRHSITKMSHIHFVSNESSAARVARMGENPEHVYVVGSTGLDAIEKAELMSRDDFFDAIGFEPNAKNLLLTFHPVTLGQSSSCEQFGELLAALDGLGEDTGLIFTRPNADTEGRALNAMLDRFVASHPHAKAYDVLGSNYLCALKHVDAVVGNSSSGLYEAPSFGIASVNIGDRQKGRLQATSVINCEADRDAIKTAITRALDEDFSSTRNPFGDGHASERIVKVLCDVADPAALLQKHFFMGEQE
ncbi:UDP-N-acetylglucosamine 2-epimerase (hydrolyzing) [Mariprofundus erugo]|uniref:UDP-N-acetylglucosamine 2-epimerase (Hydrolyzing) n=1 Tax=Mariprofundus erugo TaxID=2528639 RepID=A0A5R9GQQ7_9PROT|nr:UDP-N-acetylglucosamine 2-epimerase [Mariprofundus erugo]TLS66733.1 UDP-N-acetylglucosamine 2-epimerase (hydrolyzing) [Mariprofundus erugo]